MIAWGMKFHLFLHTVPWKKIYTKLLEVHCLCRLLPQDLHAKIFHTLKGTVAYLHPWHFLDYLWLRFHLIQVLVSYHTVLLYMELVLILLIVKYLSSFLMIWQFNELLVKFCLNDIHLADVLSSSKSEAVSFPSHRLKQSKSFPRDDESTSPSVSGTGESGACKSYCY